MLQENTQSEVVEMLPIPISDYIQNNALANFSEVEKRIGEFKAKYSGLTIKGLEDKEGLKVVHAARIEMKNSRVGWNKIARTVKAPLLSALDKINNRLSWVNNEMESLEKPLHLEEKRIQKLKQEKRDAFLQDRIDKMAEWGVRITIQEASKFTIKSFKTALKEARDAHYRRIEEEARQKALEAAELAKQQVVAPISNDEPKVAEKAQETSVNTPQEQTPIEEVAPTVEAPTEPQVETVKSDKCLLMELVENINSLPIPEVESDRALRILFFVKRELKTIADYITDKSSALP